MSMKKLMVFLFFFALGVSTVAQQSPIYIKVGEANLKKSLIAMPSFQFQGNPASVPSYAKVGKELFDTVSNDLKASDFFDFVNQSAYLEDPTTTALKPAPGTPGGFSFDKWKPIGAEFLIRNGYKITGDELVVESYLYFVPQAKQVLAKVYKASVSDARTVAHTFANDVVKELTGQRGMFLTKLVTVRATEKGQKEIFVMDWDGANVKQITNHRSITQSPAWAPDGKSIAYTWFAWHANQKITNADLFIYELNTGKRFVISYQKGINSGAAFTPDNHHVLLTISGGGNPDIFKITTDGKQPVRLTNGPKGAMNVEPSMSPDGRKIAFSSDRSGRPMVYVMDADGGNIKRVTFAGEYNSSPRWSPDGKKIVFAGHDGNHFDLFVMNSDGTSMNRLTSAKKPDGKMADNEDPSFSPDGRHILFVSNRTGLNQLYMVSVDGETERRITFDRYEYFRPQWSPFLD
jgi:TolB protein